MDKIIKFVEKMLQLLLLITVYAAIISLAALPIIFTIRLIGG